MFRCSSEKFFVAAETFLKAYILTHGIVFSKKALQRAIVEKAKIQNLVYNMPLGVSNTHPQELIIKNKSDLYETVVSCVAPNNEVDPVYVDFENDELVCFIDGARFENVDISFVKQPDFYTKVLSNGECVKKYISVCGFDEFNIIPWKGCALSRKCLFCGANTFLNKEDVSAFDLSKDELFWNIYKQEYLPRLKEAALIAKKSSCYEDHMHVVMIAGNLRNDLLDREIDIFIEIAKQISPIVNDKATEGIVLVSAPPLSDNRFCEMKKAGISKVVFNLEALCLENFKKFCPGKNDLGYDFWLNQLKKAVEVFGVGNVWSNLVLGLESNSECLEKCNEISQLGIVLSANVLHLDKGNSLNCHIPSMNHVIDFFYHLNIIYKQYSYLPFYCSKALRTSLSNEVYDNRVIQKDG